MHRLIKFAAAVLLLALASFAQAPRSPSSRDFDVRDYGAKGDGAADCTAAIQAAIEACATSGGGRVVVPSGGVYKTYTLKLRNDVELHIARGATLKGGEDPLLYEEFGPTGVWNVERSIRFNKRAMFYTCGATNVAITGAGTIDGNAEAFHHKSEKRNWTGYNWWRNSDTNITGRCVFFVGCRDVRMDDVLIYHPSGWSTFFLDCERVGIRGVRIETQREFPNGDGLHFGACRDVTVSDCIIDSMDDSIIVRNHQELLKEHRVCERMVFQNCVLRSEKCAAVRIGYTCDGPVRDVLFDNIVVERCGNAVLLELRDIPKPPAEWMDPPRGRGLAVPPPESRVPFSAENIRFSNFRANCLRNPIFLFIAETERISFARNISFRGCDFRSAAPPLMLCRPGDGISNWRFSDVTFDVTKPRGSPRSKAACFENVRDVSFDNVRWNFSEEHLPE